MVDISIYDERQNYLFDVKITENLEIIFLSPISIVDNTSTVKVRYRTGSGISQIIMNGFVTHKSASLLRYKIMLTC